MDSELYPEHYRKTSDNVKGSNSETPEPFCIGLIEDIKESASNELKIKVRKFYRPENTHKGFLLAYQQDLNQLYWSEEGKAYLVFVVGISCRCFVSTFFMLQYKFYFVLLR